MSIIVATLITKFKESDGHPFFFDILYAVSYKTACSIHKDRHQWKYDVIMFAMCGDHHYLAEISASILHGLVLCSAEH